MLKKLLRLFFRCLSERNYYRLARFLWADSRRDSENVMQTNGEIQLLKALLNASGKETRELVMFDIGANVGAYSANLLEIASGTGRKYPLKLYAFEPNQNCIAEIRSKVAAFSSIADVEVVEGVVSNYNGATSFFLTGATSGSSSLIVENSSDHLTKIETSSVTLDSFCESRGLKGIFFAKVDTEGNDMRVLEGAKGLLQRGAIDYIQIEYNHRWIYFRNYLKDVFDLVEPFGYKVAKVIPNGLEVYPNWHFELEVFWEGNFLLSKNFDRIGVPLLKSAIF